MKNLIVLFCLLSTFLGIKPNETKGPTEDSIIIKEGNLYIEGTQIDQVWTHQSFKKALGTEDRIDERIHTYDSKGIMLWTESGNKDQITEFKILFRHDSNLTHPWFSNEIHKGRVTVEGIEITEDTSLKLLLEQLPQFNFSKNFLGSYSGMYKGIYIYAQHDESLEKLVWLAIGIDDEDSWN